MIVNKAELKPCEAYYPGLICVGKDHDARLHSQLLGWGAAYYFVDEGGSEYFCMKCYEKL